MPNTAIKDAHVKPHPSGWAASCIHCDAGMDAEDKCCPKCKAPVAIEEGVARPFENIEEKVEADCGNEHITPPIRPSKTIEYMKVEQLLDSDADTEYLDKPVNKNRKEEYADNKFCYVGLRATAEIKIPMHKQSNWEKGQGCWMHQIISSGGIWSIESDSPKAHMRAMAKNTLEELREMLLELDFDESMLNKKCTQALKREEDWEYSAAHDEDE